MNKKYEILNGSDAECIKFYDKTLYRTLYRIRALKDFANVKAGDIGGFIESESNLSQEGDAWIYDNARIFGNARISGNARIWGNVRIYGDAKIYRDAEIYGDAWIHDNVVIRGNARIFGDAVIRGNARIYDNARIYGDAEIFGDAMISGNAEIYGNALIYGNARIWGNAEIMSRSHILTIGNIGSRNGTTTFFTGADGKIYVACGCFRGDIDKFEEAVQKTHGDNIHGRTYQMAIETAKVKFGLV